MERSLSILLLGLLLLGQLSLAVEGEQPLPEAVLANPKAAELSIKVWLDREAYEAGERLRIHFISSCDCYIYIYNISAQGKVTILFPNAFHKDNFLNAGRHTLPDDRYSLVVEGQPGIEYIQAIASTRPIEALVVPQGIYEEAPFPVIGTEPQELKIEVEEEVERLSAQEWAADWTSFYLLEPGRAWLVVVSEPSGAQVYIDGKPVGQTPLAVSAAPGFVRITLRKEGYWRWSEQLHLGRNEVEEIEAQLELISAILPPPAPQTPSSEAGGGLLAGLGFNLGIDWKSLGMEVGLLRELRLGTAARFTGDQVPGYYEVPPPEEPWPGELIYNDGPEVEFYLLLAVPLGERPALALGGGLAVQEQVHIAAAPEGSSLPQDVVIKPNGYRTTKNYLTALGGLILKTEPFFLELDYHSRRGFLLGIGIGF